MSNLKDSAILRAELQRRGWVRAWPEPADLTNPQPYDRGSEEWSEAVSFVVSWRRRQDRVRAMETGTKIPPAE